MTSAACEKILREAQLLSPREVEDLIISLIGQREKKEDLGSSEIGWEDVRGSAQYPICGEDAQEWVTRTRREADESLTYSPRWPCRTPST